jgi:cellulose synthase/poly-beta-1,6-N-acetylglucosamine synthase-like glycosyltransferase
MTLGVVIPCYRQERFVPRTVEGRSWRGVLVRAAPASEPLPALGPAWTVIAPPVSRPLTPGAARMLGFAACGGEWVLFVDADVEVEAAWLERALATAAREPGLGGLWGRIEEWFVAGRGEPAERVRRGSPDMYKVGEGERRVPYLATLALYRRAALIAAGGYDARLSSEEDFELGLRCGGLGLELRSLPALAARHWSDPRPSFAELARRWRTGLCLGQGQVLRLYLGRRGLATLVRRQALNLATLGMWALGLAAVAAALAARDPAPLVLWLALPLLVIAVMTARKRSVRLAVHSLLSWSLNATGLAVGFLRRPEARGPVPPPAEAGC